MDSYRQKNRKEFLISLIKPNTQYIRLWEYIRYFLERDILKKKYTVRRILGFNFVLDLENEGISGTLAIFGIREIDHTTIMIQELEPNMICLDIGSNIGYYALIMARIVGENGEVYAFEPDPRNYKILEMNIKYNNFDNIIKKYLTAVGAVSGQSTMMIMDKSNLNTLVNEEEMLTKDNLLKEKITVSVTTIDNIYKKCQKNIDFIRMDIEGFEVEVIQGGMIAFGHFPHCKILLEG